MAGCVGRRKEAEPMPKWLKITLAAGVGTVLVLGVAFWWFILRDDAPPEARLPTRSPAASSATTAAGQAAHTGTIAGSWSVIPGQDVFAGYRIQEKFGGDTVEKTAVGRSPV